MSFFKTKEIKLLTDQIQELRQEISNIKEFRVYYGDWRYGDRKHLSAGLAIEMLLKHFNIDFKHIPSVSGSFKIISTKPKKK